MPPSIKRKFNLARAERAREGRREKHVFSTPTKPPLPAEPPANVVQSPFQPGRTTEHSSDLELRPAPDANDVHDGGSNSDNESEIDDSEPTVEPLCRSPPTNKEAMAALDSLDAAIRTHRRTGKGYDYLALDRVTLERCSIMMACLNLYLDDTARTFIDASLLAAKGHRRGATYARSVRRWIRCLISSGDLPQNCWGWWNVSSLEDEDVSNEIKLHLQSIGKYARAQDVVDFLSSPEVRERLGLKKKVGLRTAQRWLSRSGFRWRAEPKGQYFDGHEREDVVAYRQSIIVPFWKATERQRILYGEDGLPIPEHKITLQPGEKRIIFWFHDESIFYANDRRHIRWVYVGEHAIPYQKGEGCSIMVADFMCAEFGWLRGANGEDARVIMSPGKSRDGYFTGEKVVEQLKTAISIAKGRYPDYTHVFLYDNAPAHVKRPVGSISARKMPKMPAKNFTFPSTDGQGRKIQVRMEDGRLPDGTHQPFYFPNDHPSSPGYFKGMAQILRERGMAHVAEKRAECPGFKCERGRTDCCCRRALFCQPDFRSRASTLEEVARGLGSLVVFLPKYHCELNPIEQCWGYAKRLYREKPNCRQEATMKKYVIEVIESVPELSMRKFAARSQRFIDAYASGLGGSEAIKWATKEHRGHRQTPAHIPYSAIAPTYMYQPPV
ncbi:DDE superfamily endonuclease [Ceratobasidium sp. AG-Ba]|nr:DDE superfamily endonuclease [Ceratobasidium sp. AG-Ba]